MASAHIQAKEDRRTKKKLYGLALFIKFFGILPNIDPRLIPLLSSLIPKVEAYNELRRRYLQQPMTPELGYDLIKSAYEDEKAAMEVKMKLLLNSMPEPKANVNQHIR